MKGLYRCAILVSILSWSTTIFGQTSGDYRSFASGNWSAAGSWETFNGANWVAASSAPSSADGVITIQNAHTITITSNLSIDQVVVASGGTLQVDVFVTLTLLDGVGVDLDNNGTFALLDDDFFDGSALSVGSNATVSNSGVLLFNDALSQMNFQSGSTYVHGLNGGNIPRADWSSTSTCQITGVTNAAPGQLDQTFGNLDWNSSLQSGTLILGFSGTSSGIGGNFNITDTNGKVLVFSGSGGTALSITGNLTVSGTSRFSVTTSVSSVTVNVNGAYQNSSVGGCFLATTGTGILNIKGNFTQSAGTLQGNSTSELNFYGTSAQTFIGGGAFKSLNFTVKTGATLDLGTFALTDAGNFTNQGTIRIGSTHTAGALQLAPAVAGNIQVTGTRTYASGSTVIYNGAGAQFIGDGHPSESGVNTTINNSSGVTLSASAVITGALTLTSGNLSLGSNTLTLSGSFTPNSNFLNITSSSNLTINGTGAFGSLAIMGSSSINNFTINRTSSGTVTLGTDLTIAGTFTQTAGDLILNGKVLTLSGAYSRTAGSISVNSSSSLAINGSGTVSALSFSGTALNTLTLDRASVTVATGSSLTLTNLNLVSGTFDNTGTITMATGGTITRSAQGSMSAAPTAATSYNVVYDIGNDISTGVELPTGSTELNNLTKDGSAILALSNPLTVNGTLTLTSGTFNSGTHALDIKGNLVSNATSQLTSSAITFSGTTIIGGGTAPTFGGVTISGSVTPSVNYRINGNLDNNGTLYAGTVTATFGGTTTVSGTGTTSFNHLVINSTRTLTASTGTINVAGNFTNNGTFNNNGGTVVFNGTTSISGSQATEFANITISGTLNGPANLNLTGNFTNNGTFNRGTGTVVFKGNSPQSIGGTSVTDFNNINVTNTAGPPAVQVVSNQNLRGILTLASNSKFDADGGGSAVFTLVSISDDPTTDAGIATLPTGASVTGNVSVQRYMAIEGTGGRMYRYISSPVQSAAVSQIQSEIPVTGDFTGASTCSGCKTNQSMFGYDETVGGDLNSGYADFPAASNAEALELGKGYTIYVRGDVDPVLSAGSARWDVRNPINSGTVNFPVSFTSSGNVDSDGWNLIGNPYPSTIDWNAVTGWTKSLSISGTIYMRDNGSSGIYATWNGTTGVNGGSRYIAMGQAFWVKSNGSVATSLSANEDVKTAGTQTKFFREATPSDLFRVTLRQGPVRDESVIHFREDATENYDHHADAYKLKNVTFNLSSIAATGGVKLAINSLPSLTCGRTVRLDVSDVEEGAYQLEFSQFETFSDEVEISLYDAFADTRLNPKEVTSYPFEVTADTSSFGANRFSVSFSYKNPAEALVDFPAEVCKGGDAVINIENSEAYVSYSVYSNGVAITEAIAGNGGSLEIPIETSLLTPGDNDFILNYSPSDCKSMVSSKQVKIKAIDTPALTATDVSHCGSGSVSLTASGGEDGNYRWYESETDDTAIGGVNSAIYATPVLNKSRTYHVSAVNSLGCEGERIPVKAVIQQYDAVAISVDPDQNALISSYDAGNQWYFNGKQIPGATEKTLKVTETGLFEVEVTVNGCTSRVAREMIVLGTEESFDRGVHFFPNPVRNKFSIEVADSETVTTVGIYSSYGQLVGKIELTSAGDKLKGEYDFENHPAGVYFLKVTQGARTMNYKIIRK